MTGMLYPPEGAFEVANEQPDRALQRAALSGEILCAVATQCDEKHNLLIDFCGLSLKIERNEADLGVKMNKARDIAILSRVGRQICFSVTGIKDGDWWLSRAAAQKIALEHHLKHTPVGGIIPAKVTHLEPFGAFVDVGCGAVSFIGVENISVSRIEHPRQRFHPGQDIFAAVLDKNAADMRLSLTHRELLGTWDENAGRLEEGATVRGIVRSIMPYGTFVELLPNLSGLAESSAGLAPGDGVSVYIKSIHRESMKIKLVILDRLHYPPSSIIVHNDYILPAHPLKRWRYSPECCAKTVERIFEVDGLTADEL